MAVNLYNKARLFFSLSTFCPWVLWFLAGYISYSEVKTFVAQLWVSILSFLGLLAPLFIAIYLALKNEEVFTDIKRRFFNFKQVKFTYILLSVALMPMSILLAQSISLLFGYSLEQFNLSQSFSFISGVFPVWVILIIAPVIEELAWHSYGTDVLRFRYNLFKTSMIFSLFWGIWHLPLTSIKDYYHSNLVEDGWLYSLNFLISLFPFVLIMNWMYYKANRNIILPILFHVSAGYFNEIFSTHPMSKVIQTFLLIGFALYLIYNDKSFFFNKNYNVS